MNSRFPCVIPVVERCSTSAQVVQSQWLGGGGAEGEGRRMCEMWGHGGGTMSCYRLV